MNKSFHWLILNTDYPEFLQWLYAQHPALENSPYEEQMQVRVDSLFGVADFYSSNLRKLGHEAYDIHANNEPLQKAWAKEHGIAPGQVPLGPIQYMKRLFRLRRRLGRQQAWLYDVLAAQIKYYRPDVLLSQDMGGISSRFLKEMKPYVGLLAGQIASPLPKNEDFRCYDLVLSSLPNFVDHFRRVGVPAQLHRLAFEPRVLNRLNKEQERIPVSFVGSLSRHHEARIRLLEYLCKHLEIEVWGLGVDSIAENSLVRQRYKGRSWGIQMYQVLQSSRMTLNHHIGVADSYANNMRLYEATGVGTLLITDWKVNLHEMFEPAKEVVTYCNPEECAELIQYYLKHDDKREAIACAGQERTLREHTYYQRMAELVEIIDGFARRKETMGRRVFAGS